MRQCAFCPSTKLSREHIWSDWINGILIPTTYTVQRKLSEHGEFTQWKTSGLQQTARVVCKPCNNGWMSHLEQYEAKPTMSDMIRHGGAVSLLPRGIASIAAFAFKMTVLANHIGKLKNDPPYFSEAERYNFAKTIEIPSGIQVWLFALNTPGRITGKFNSHLGRLPLTVKYGFDLYVCTFAVGHLGLQVVAGRWANPHISAFMRFPGVGQDDKWDNAAIPVWPNDGTPVLWPPPDHLNNDSIDAFCNRWRDFEVPKWVVSGFPV